VLEYKKVIIIFWFWKNTKLKNYINKTEDPMYMMYQIYMILMRPIVLYASETWVLRKAEETRLRVFERRRTLAYA